MIFAIYSELNDGNIQLNLGRPQYSYYFLLKSFRQVFATLGEVVHIKDPELEVDALFDASKRRGQDCLFVCFTPPNLAPVQFRCPTLCLFAWEFSTIPSDSWDGNPANDWRWVFKQLSGVIATSSDTAAVVAAAMEDVSESLPVLSLPTPTWEDMSRLRECDAAAHLDSGSRLQTRGYLQDSASIDFDLKNLLPRHFYTTQFWEATQRGPANTNTFNQGLQPMDSTQPRPSRIKIILRRLKMWSRDVFTSSDNLTTSVAPAASPPMQNQDSEDQALVEVSGIVYTTVLNPEDGRKCHLDLLTAFVWAFRDKPDVTLIMKMTQKDSESYKHALNHTLHQLFPFQCRIIIFNGFLSSEEYEDLINASTFYVNTSYCEGLCIPLMEFLSAGKPVIAPMHTAMADYINKEFAFITESSIETNVWPQDPRGKYTAERYRNNWESIVRAYHSSYETVSKDRAEYARRSKLAMTTMEKFCSLPAVSARLGKFISEDLRMSL